MKKLAFLLLLPFFVACSSPADRMYSEETWKQDLEDIKQANKMSDEEVAKVSAYIPLAEMTDKELEGKTYNQILHDAEDTDEEAENFGEEVKGNMQEVGEDIKEGTQELGQDIKEGTQKVGNEIKEAGNDVKDEINGEDNK